MFIYLRILLVLLAIPFVVSGGVLLRNEVACFDSDAAENIKSIETEFFISAKARNGGIIDPHRVAQCTSADVKDAEYLTNTRGSHYVTCGFRDDKILYQQNLFILSRCWYVKDVVYPSEGLPVQAD